MARIPNDQLEKIKHEVSLLRLAESQGHTPVKHGKDYAVCCPFHEDKTPSCIISPKNNLFNCFGCGAGGSVIDWVMKTQGVGFRHAVEILRDDSSLVATAASTPVKKNTVPKLESPLSEGVSDQVLLTQVVAYYHQTLKQSPEAQAYLKKRGLNDSELVNHFKLGYANRTLGLRLPRKNRKAGKEIREQLQSIGIYRETGREHFNGCLVIPTHDANGAITEAYGRKIIERQAKGLAKHLYLPRPHEGVFNVQGWTSAASEGSTGAANVGGLNNTDEVILCESLIDALTFWRWGFRHVTCSYGVNGFTDELLQAFVDYKIKRVLIAYDRDEAGDKAAEKLAPVLQQNGIDAFRILFPKNMDANSYALHVTPAEKSLGLVLRKAEFMGDAQGKKITTQKALVQPVLNELPSPAKDIDVHTTATEILITLGDRVYRVRGLDKNNSMDQLKIQLMARKVDACDVQGSTNIAGAGSAGAMHMDKLDLYSSKQRQVFINQACVELGIKDEVIKKDLGKVLLTLEEQQAQQQDENKDKQPAELAPKERQAALELLQNKALLQRILHDFNHAGVVGEETNKLAGYLSCVSRKLDKPLAVIIQSSSAAGKSSLMDSILALMPEEERVQYSAMTGQSLFYMGETNLKHKILAISEEEGASNASYALKLLQSEGEVTIASTGKDDSSGNLVTKEYKVEGPVMLFLTTTAIDIDEELMNRCVVLSVNESREQTQAIHAAQRAKRTLQGLHNKLEKERIIQLHRNAQRLLKPLHVINPYADQLTFLDDKTRTRRDHEKYLTLIDSIALLHQYQREIKTIAHHDKTLAYVEVSLNDIAHANAIAHEVLGKTLDELPPQTRKLLNMISRLVKSECQAQQIERCDVRFSRRQVRECCGWGETQVRVHMQRLLEMEYLLAHRGGRGQSFEYELLYQNEGENGTPFLMGLLDVEALQQQGEQQEQQQRQEQDTIPRTTTSRGVLDNLAGSSRPQRGRVAEDEKSREALNNEGCSTTSRTSAENALQAV